MNHVLRNENVQYQIWSNLARTLPQMLRDVHIQFFSSHDTVFIEDFCLKNYEGPKRVWSHCSSLTRKKTLFYNTKHSYKMSKMLHFKNFQAAWIILFCFPLSPNILSHGWKPRENSILYICIVYIYVYSKYFSLEQF